MIRRKIHQVLIDDRGSSAAEFALTLPILLLLLIGIINLTSMLYAGSTLNFATEAAARCAGTTLAGKAGPCATPTATQDYAASMYKGPAISPVFVATEETDASSATKCVGRMVVATATYRVNFGVFGRDVSLRAQSCFPSPIDAAAPWAA